MEKRSLTEGQRAYEAKRASKAGMSLEKWLAQKERLAAVAERARVAHLAKPKPKSLIKRLLDRAHRPIKKDSSQKDTNKKGSV